MHACMNGIVSHTRVLGARENEIEREREREARRPQVYRNQIYYSDGVGSQKTILVMVLWN